jgi:hypothetical protein
MKTGREGEEWSGMGGKARPILMPLRRGTMADGDTECKPLLGSPTRPACISRSVLFPCSCPGAA